MIGKWTSKVDCLSMTTSEYNRSGNRQIFFKVVNQEKDKVRKAAIEKAAKERAAAKEKAQRAASKPAPTYSRYDDDDDVTFDDL